MDFHYYYLIQDLWGILLLFVSIRYVWFVSRNRKLIRRAGLLICNYSLIGAIGGYLLFRGFSLANLVISILFIAVDLTFLSKYIK